ncbi:MAG: ATP-binding cassette domain-containing protein [Gammaproteobacteria bacterium]|nr:ATP-binding cassette domain-containing protein [Gammaproteobacteria bacterium]
MIELHCVQVTYPGGVALQDLSLTVAAGQMLVLVGESGSGKTTTLKLVNRRVDPTSGTVLVDGRNVATVDAIALRRSVGTVFQRFGLFPHMTVAENVGLLPRLMGCSAADIHARVNTLLEMVGLAPQVFGDRFPAELSGGQQQRVGVARALAPRPRILLMDEPFGALDPVTREGLATQVRQLHVDLGLTTVLVTHDMTEALLMGDQVAVMHAGVLLQLGTPAQLLHAPSSDRVRALLETPRLQVERLGRLVSGAA